MTRAIKPDWKPGTEHPTHMNDILIVLKSKPAYMFVGNFGLHSGCYFVHPADDRRAAYFEPGEVAAWAEQKILLPNGTYLK